MLFRCISSSPRLPLPEELKLELKLELQRKPAVEETSEMDVEVWSKLPEELLMRVLSHLPTLIMKNFMIVCKSWRREFQQSRISDPSVCLCPAFLIGGLYSLNDHRRPIHHLFLLQSLPTYPLRKLSLDFLGTCGHIMTTVKSLLCYRHYPSFSKSGDSKSNLFSICNPITRTLIRLPPIQFYPHFIAMSFDPCERRCMLVVGVNNNAGGNRNQLVVEIFDSQISTWIKLEMDVPLSVFPKGEGLFSRGSFYWINYTPFDQRRRPMFRFDVVAYDVAEKRWDVIRRPERGTHIPEFEYYCCWKLTGYDGNVVLVDETDMSLWKLNIGGCEGPSWSELEVFPRRPYEEIISNRNKLRENGRRNFSYGNPHIKINSCGWVLVYHYSRNLAVFDPEGRMMRSIEGNLLKVFKRESPRLPVYAYEINNVWWP